MARRQVIALIVPKYGIRQEFGIEHAERLLGMGTQQNGGWEIPKGSRYYYSKENGIRVKSNKANFAETE